MGIPHFLQPLIHCIARSKRTCCMARGEGKTTWFFISGTSPLTASYGRTLSNIFFYISLLIQWEAINAQTDITPTFLILLKNSNNKVSRIQIKLLSPSFVIIIKNGSNTGFLICSWINNKISPSNDISKLSIQLPFPSKISFTHNYSFPKNIN